ncbi:DUF551 domain-containing protein [Enterobacter hormaechei subsp. steigerwaltii]
MSTLTKEWLLKTIAELEEERDAVPGVVNVDAAMALAAMKIALASLEAEPVAFRSKLQPPSAIGSERWDYTDHRQPDAFELENCVIERLYTAPPAPVVDADDNFYSWFGREWHEHYQQNQYTTAAKQMLGVMAESAWKAGRRAAMLQGAEPVTTDYKLPFDQWLSQQTGTIDVECGCVMTEVFFHWLRVAYEAGNSPVISDGWVACSEQMPHIGVPVITCCGDVVQYAAYAWDGKEWQDWYEEYDKLPANTFTHWHPRPAAPQQEVK